MLLGGLFGGSQGITIALTIALIMNIIAYFFSDQIVLSMYGAQNSILKNIVGYTQL